MPGNKITRRQHNYFFVRVGSAADTALDLSGDAAANWTAIAALCVAANEIRVMEFDPGSPSSSEESESSYGDDQAFTFTGATTQGTATLQIIDATAEDGRLTAAQAAAANGLINLDDQGNIDLVRLRTGDVSRATTGAYPASPSITNAVAYYFRGKKANERLADGSPMDRYVCDIVQSQRFIRVPQA